MPAPRGYAGARCGRRRPDPREPATQARGLPARLGRAFRRLWPWLTYRDAADGSPVQRVAHKLAINLGDIGTPGKPPKRRWRTTLMGKNVNVFKAGQVETGAHRQKTETGFGESGAALPLEHNIELGLEGMQVEHVVGGVLFLLIAQFLSRPVGTLLVLGQLNPQKLAAKVLKPVPIGVGA